MQTTATFQYGIGDDGYHGLVLYYDDHVSMPYRERVYWETDPKNIDNYMIQKAKSDLIANLDKYRPDSNCKLFVNMPDSLIKFEHEKAVN
jgi:hypothetical protein